MPPIANHSPEAVDREAEVQGGFMFVALTGQKGQVKDRGTRRKLRAHVMHNFRDKETKQHSKGLPAEAADDIAIHESAGPIVVGQKLRFRLGDNGRLEESVPLRQRKNKAAPKSEGKGVAEVIPDKLPEGREAIPTPDLEEWMQQYFREEPDDQSNLTPDFQLPLLLPTSRKGDFATLTEENFGPANQRNFWEDIAVDYSLAHSTQALTQRLPTSPLLPFGIARLDPLNTLPFRLSRRDEEFIDRFQHWETDSWCPVNGRGTWFTHAMQDKLLFHATMYHWGMHFTRTSNDFHVRNPEILEHKLSSFHMINEKLNDNEGFVTDETLAAVAAIVNIEISFGSREDAKKHMKGLETLVEMKGGMERLKGSFEGVLQRFVGWNDLNYAELFGSQLRFAKDCDYVSSPEKPCFRQAMIGVDYGPLVWERLQGDVINLLHEVRVLCEEVDTRPFRDLQEKDRVSRSDAMHRVERKLRMLTEVEQEDAILESPQDRMWRATALAGLMYVHHMLRFLPLAYRQFNSLSRDLQTAIALTGGPKGTWKNAPEILVWALTTGTIISTGRMEHRWYVEKLASACRDIGYTNWEQYREKMKSFLWVERLDDARYRKVWDQIEILL